MKLPHESSALHVTGRAEYVDDRPLQNREVHLAVVGSREAHARIKSVDLTKAFQSPGVLAVYVAKDFQHNLWGTIFKDQPLLAHEEVAYFGESIAIVVGETLEAAYRGRDLVKVTYEWLNPILSISEARRQESWIGSPRSIARGDVDAALGKAPHRIEGKLVIRGADHFYLESQASIAYPREDGQIEIHSSSQHPTEVQHVVAHSLGLPSKDVSCIVRRMGGAFGGKESQAAPFAAYAALAAHRLQRPARIVLNKDDDMVMTGKRNPFESHYRVGFDKEGRILALDVELYSDGGAYADLSTSIMERAMLHCDNAYYIPHFRVKGRVCRTHFHPHTAFRGFGGPKGVATIERIIEEIAAYLGMDPLDVRKLNAYTVAGERNLTPYGQPVGNCVLPELFAKLEESSDYRSRREEISRENTGVLSGKRVGPLRGLSLTAVKFGISFTTRFLNQANALVILHRDGTLQVSTGATEMGQGVHTRIAEIVSRELGLTRDKVRMMATSTDKNANTSPTAASSGTDLNGSAALVATRRIKARLSALAARVLELPERRWARNSAGLGTEEEMNTPPEADAGALSDESITYQGIQFADGKVYREGDRKNQVSFPDLVNEAYLNRISLTEYAHYRIPGLSFNKLTGKGNAFLYYTQGTAVSEVSVNPDTGEVKVERVDILMDLGRPIHEGLDLGQVTGGFVQGMGWMTTENLFYSDRGGLLSHSPSTYKIPSVQDTPRVFNVTLFPNEGNQVNLARTKAVGEPPLLLSISVWTAVLDALRAVRTPLAVLEIPATQEAVLRALWPDRFAELEGRIP